MTSRIRGIRYQAGDRCGILPKNSPELVERTLKALRASGDEVIHLNEAWRWHVNLRDGFQNATELPLRTLLEFGQIRPVSRAAALHLFSLTHNERLRRILDAWAEDQWELWDLLESAGGSRLQPAPTLESDSRRQRAYLPRYCAGTLAAVLDLVACRMTNCT